MLGQCSADSVPLGCCFLLPCCSKVILVRPRARCVMPSPAISVVVRDMRSLCRQSCEPLLSCAASQLLPRSRLQPMSLIRAQSISSTPPQGTEEWEQPPCYPLFLPRPRLLCRA